MSCYLCICGQLQSLERKSELAKTGINGSRLQNQKLESTKKTAINESLDDTSEDDAKSFGCFS